MTVRRSLSRPAPQQRHTAKWIFERLWVERDAQVSHSYVARYVGRRRGEIAVEAAAREAGRAGVMAGFVPQQPAGRGGRGRLRRSVGSSGRG